MEKLRLGRTNLEVTRTSFGALPIQRIPKEDAAAILRRAYEGGINYFDTARAYTDSEEKIACALGDVRKDIIISTKTQAKEAKAFWNDLETSLKTLKTDCIDIYQFHNPPFVPKPGGKDGLYDAALEAKKKGMIRFIGITNHGIDNGFEAVNSGLYDTLQFPFSVLSGEREIELVDLCKEKDVGFIAMKALSGGLITDAVPTFCFIRSLGNVVPIWGVQRMSELEQFLSLEAAPPAMDDDMRAMIEKDKKELSGDFCRGCGYCMPCPVGIQINMAARMYYLVTRSPYQRYITPEQQKGMDKIEDCINCRSCASRCPYGLDTPELLKRQLRLYREFVREHS